MKSEQINEIAMALCDMQGELHDTKKESQAYNYKYSDLSQILTYIRPLMSKNGLSVTQLVNGEASGSIGVETILMHKSGQWISTSAFMGVQGQNLAQEAGKVSTYLRRYQLAGIIGLTQTDNDAQTTEKAPNLPTHATSEAIKAIKACTGIQTLESEYKKYVKGLDKVQSHFINEATNAKKLQLEVK